MDFPTNKVKPYNIDLIVKELSVWVDNYKGFINCIFSEQVTMEEKVTKLFWVVKTVAESQADVINNFTELYDFVNDYFKNLNVSDEVYNAVLKLKDNGTLSDIINNELFGELNERLSIIENKHNRYIIISDSYGLVPSNDENWIVDIKRTISNKDNDFYSSAENGSGFIGVEGRKTYSEQLDSLEIEDPSSITHIIVVGGYNDASALRSGKTDSDLRDAIISFCSKCSEKYPAATVYIGMVGWTVDGSEATQHRYLMNVINAYYQSAYLYKNCRYLGGLETTLHCDLFLDDTKYHPTAIGGELISNGVINCLNGLTPICPTYNGILDVVITKSVNFNITITNFKAQILNDLVWGSFSEILMEGSVSLPRAELVELGSLSSNVLWGGDSLETAYKCLTVVAINDGTFHEVMFYIYKSKLYARALKEDISTDRLLSFDVWFTGSAML